jgi:hypothetical protein
MANVKISELTGASLPLTGTELVPVVQGGVTKNTTVFDGANLSGSPIFIPSVITYGGTTVAAIVNDYDGLVSYSSEIKAPNLTTVDSEVYLYPSFINILPLLQTINLPLLQTVGYTSVTNEPIGVYINEFSNLTTLDISSLTTVRGGTGCSIEIANLSLTTIDISSLTTVEGTGKISFAGNALTQVAVDAILNQLANVVNASNRLIDLSGGTNSAPSATGATYKATLIANGCTVTTN